MENKKQKSRFKLSKKTITRLNDVAMNQVWGGINAQPSVSTTCPATYTCPGTYTCCTPGPTFTCPKG